MPALFGWLFDAYPSGDGMRVWLIDADGRPLGLQDSFVPAFYAHGPAPICTPWRTACGSPARRLRCARTERIDLFLDRPIEVLEVGVRQPRLLPQIFQRVARAQPKLTYYDADIPLPQRYVLARGIFPLAYCAVEAQGEQIQRIEALDYALGDRIPPAAAAGHDAAPGGRAA